MSIPARLSALSRAPVATMMAWERYFGWTEEPAADPAPPAPEGPVEGLMDELLARWPDEALEGQAARRRDGVRWAKLHEPRPAPPPWAA